MKESESKVLEAAAILYNAIPGYLAQTESKQQMGHYLVELIDALDDIEYSRSGTPLYDIIGGSAPGRRKISPSTAKAHKYSIFKKLGVHTSDELKAMLEQSEAHPAADGE